MKNIKTFIPKIFQKKEKPSKFERLTRRFKRDYPQFKIGRGSYGVPLVHPSFGGAVLQIGSFCSISSNVQIYLGGEHRTDWVTTSPLNTFFEEKGKYEHERTKGDVIIGNDVWLCANTTILSGVTIGDGAVIANGAVVSRDVEPYSITAGNPARHLRFRFSADIVSALVDIAWWDWPEDILRQHLDKLLTPNIADFISYARKLK